MAEFIRFESDLEVACKEMIKAVEVTKEYKEGEVSKEYKEGFVYVKDFSSFPLSLFKTTVDPSKYTLKLFKDAQDFFHDISNYVDEEQEGIYFVIRFENLKVHPMALKLFKAVCDMLVNGLKCRIVLVNSKGNLQKLF